jgi:hypothetical protein
MSASHSDAIRRIADVKGMIARQQSLKSELETKGLPVEHVDDLIEILRGCLWVIEASIRADDPEMPLGPPPAVLVNRAA